MDIRQKVKKRIEIIKNKFEDNHYLFLSETDVVCQLYSELLKVEDFNGLHNTISGQKTIALHTEVPFFSRQLREGQNPILNRWVDIAILNQAKMTFNRSDFRLSRYSSKIYRFEEERCCIEVKLNSIDSKRKCLEDMKNDLNKLKILNSKISFMLFLDKRSHLSNDDLEALRREYTRTEIIYGKPANN